MANGRAVPRRESGASGHATIQRRPIELIFQRYPGTEAEAAIQGLNYEITVGGSPPSRGTTGADGKVTVRLGSGETADLNIMGTTYVVRARTRLEPVDQLRGVQRRLNILGYNAGPVDGDMGPRTELAVLNFQADNSPLVIDGLPGPRTQRALRDRVGE
jgi:hypothetical protein